MPGFVEFSAKNTASALLKAERHFGIPLSRLEVDIVTTGSGGFLGMFGKQAIIKVRPAPDTSVQDAVASILGMEAGGPQKKKDTPPPASPKPPKPPKQPKAHVAAEEAEAGNAAQGADALDENELIAKAEEVVRNLCRPLIGEVDLHSRYEDSQLIVMLSCAEPGAIIGRRAQILDSLQYLAARIVSHCFGCSISLMLDVEEYRSRQQRQLAETALKLAAKAEQQGRPFTMGPLSTQDRRIVHKTLKGRPLQTFSKGQGDFKRVVIAPLKQAR